MIDHFRFVIRSLLQHTSQGDPFLLVDARANFHNLAEEKNKISRALNAAFIFSLAGESHPAYKEASAFLERMTTSPVWEVTASFYLKGIMLIEEEIDSLGHNNPDLPHQLESLSNQLSNRNAQQGKSRAVEGFWSFFHPEATGIWSHEQQRIDALRAKRKVSITNHNHNPIQDPARQILFTSNVLLTLPPGGKSLGELSLSESLKNRVAAVREEPQVYWYDHPIQIGVEPDKNEVLYGLRGLHSALDFEHTHGSTSPGSQLTCVLSVSVTHDGLHGIARQYLANELQRIEPLTGLNILVFTETDTRQLIDEILAPAVKHYLGEVRAAELLSVFGVDGEYGKHYTFLKAIAALWNVLIDPQIQATFKIDLDQVFPQEELLKESGLSAFEHFMTPLWGAEGVDANDNPLELSMIAGALVNENDIHQGLFTPDVPFPPPDRKFALDEWVFFSQLPQALSTEAEMMTRYNTNELDGKRTCLQRVHVTGGTNGILVDSLRRYQPFTPSFIGRAEDQAFIFSTIPGPGSKLAYLHQAGLIMRHDKRAFALEAIQAAQVGQLIGDYVRILYYSAYADALDEDLHQFKEHVDPFTGSFISYIPITLTLVRFALKAEALFSSGDAQLGNEFVRMGTQRIDQALQFAFIDQGKLKRQYQQERLGWALYYDALSALEKGLQDGDPFAQEMRKKARELISGLAIS
ncbi:hypothetical protein ACFLY4_07480 [Chloroflexota bacterium]